MRMKRLFLTLTICLLPSLAQGEEFREAAEITPESVLAGMNFYRERHALPPLKLEPRLAIAAEGRIEDMEEHGYWNHFSPMGIGPFVRLASHGYRHAAAGENLAAGFETAGVLMSAWMESPGHRRNILSLEYTDVGIAIIDGAIGKRAVGRSVVVLFAREADPPPARPAPARF